MDLPIPRSFAVALVVALVSGVLLRVGVDELVADEAPSVERSLVDLLRPVHAPDRTVGPYGGVAVWLDAFDFEPAYQSEGVDPEVRPDDVAEFAALGVDTIFLQAARRDTRSVGTLLDETVLAEFLVHAHAHEIEVVGWYLPKFDDVDADLDRLVAIDTFEALGHRFDGVAVDIEFIEGVVDDDERSARLVELSTRLHDAVGADALGAIVPPPVQLEVVNQSYWPRFPWAELAPYYDVWLPMAYWTTRSTESGYRDAFTYVDESTSRLRNNLADADALVHPIGGLGDETTVDDLGRFAEAVAESGAIGASIYDWASLAPALRTQLDMIRPPG